MMVLEKLKVHIAHVLAVPLLGVSAKDTHMCRRRCVLECLSQHYLLQ